ncbi:MAG: VOC family protein [Alphaproteobacteria bacterium]|nr:VOC family protein [Alphaproteobacteria bacterium]
MDGNQNPSRPRRLHHAAWVTKDMEMTRQFYEDVIGIPLVATWIERNPKTGLEYCHTLFEFEDRSTLAFFQWGDEADNPRDQNSPGHVAFECDAQTQGAIKARLEAAGVAIRVTDHGYCVSLYAHDPNNLKLEFTVDHPDSEDISQTSRKTAHADLRRWVSGDHRINNDFRAR